MLRKPASGWPIADVLGETPHGDAINAWLDALALWNAKMDLTAAKDASSLVWLMLADALMLARAIPPSVSVVDVGTGAGAPGLALALMRPDLRVTLVEPLGKRASFLRSVIGTLRRTDVTLEPRNADALVPAEFDVAMSRATLPPEDWLRLGASLVRDGGSVWVLLAREEPPAIEGARYIKEETLEYEDPSSKKMLVRYRCYRRSS
jgi:16S rRNA (guanine527-N7)-methyltransferase